MQNWDIVYKSVKTEEELLREVLCSSGNGYMGIRASAPEFSACATHYPGIYVSGLYNKLTSHVAGKDITNEDMVNCPNFFFMTFRVNGGKWFNPDIKTKIEKFEQKLDMRRGVSSRTAVYSSNKSKKTMVEVLRFAHMKHLHLAIMKYSITPLNYSAGITVRTMIDGSVENTGVARYRNLNCQHWQRVKPSYDSMFAYLAAETLNPKTELIQGSHTGVFCGGKPVTCKRAARVVDGLKISEEFTFEAEKGKTYDVVKTVFMRTSRDSGKNPLNQVKKDLKNAKKYDDYLQSHTDEWRKIWDGTDIKVDGDAFAQKVLRLHTLHLIQTACGNTAGLDVAVPARGLSGEAYRGHIFWDEIFAAPFYNFHFPQAVKTSLLYRYHRLKAARKYAREYGYKGAMFPWQSASTGEEETQVIHLNPLSGKWGDDHSKLQRHISFAVAYNLWKYYQATLDDDFMRKYGWELMLSIAQFCASLAKYDPADKRYHTHNLMGPDEFHERLPGKKEYGLTDNAYSNFMIAWILDVSLNLVSRMSAGERNKAFGKTGLKKANLRQWADISRKINIIFGENGIISQFDGYFGLMEVDFDSYRKKYGNIHRMDRILKAEGKSPDDYKVSKQADVLMIFYLFDYEEFRAVFERLGYQIDREVIRKNYDYYEKRTSHGSTLSKLVHCYVSYLVGYHKRALDWYEEVLKSDIYDTQGGTTKEGIHMGVMGGSLDIAMRCFAGLGFDEGRPFFKPKLPSYWKSMAFSFNWRGWKFGISLGRNGRQIDIPRGKL